MCRDSHSSPSRRTPTPQLVACKARAGRAPGWWGLSSVYCLGLMYDLGQIFPSLVLWHQQKEGAVQDGPLDPVHMAILAMSQDSCS